MNRFLTYSSIGLLCYSLNGFAQNGEEIVLAANKVASRVQRIEWDAIKRMKFFDTDDTLQSVGHVQFMRYPGGTFLLRVETQKGFYDEEYISADTALVISKKDSTAEIFLRTYFPDNFINQFSSDVASDVYMNIRIAESQQPDLSHFLASAIAWYSNTEKPAIETIVESEKAWCVQLVRGVDSLSLTIRKADTMLTHGHSQIHWEGQAQYYSYTFENVSFAPVTPSIQQRLATLPEYFKVTIPTPDDYVRHTLPLGSPVEWAGRYLDGDTVSSTDFLGRYVLAEFTYRSCYPCKKSIPTMNKIRMQFPDLVVVGLDPFDGDNLKKLREHIKNRDVHFPTILIERNLAQSLIAGMYPTFYLIDPQGNLVWKQEGYHENYEERMLTEIALRLK